MNKVDLVVTEEENDPRVFFSSSLKVSKQCKKTALRVTGELAQIPRAFTFRNKTVLSNLY